MCGLFGWNYKRKSRLEIGKRECLATALAIANSERGDKSWGLYMFSKHGPNIRRQVGDISMVPDIATYGRFPLVMGHTRQPTSGAVTQKNSHPFTVNKITLAHNGTISNSDELDKKYNRKVRVDSQHLAHHIDENLPFDDIQGYGTISWVHADQPERIYLCRLRNGSLSVFGMKNGAGEEIGVSWSSDRRHLEVALASAHVNAYSFAFLEEGRIYWVEGGKLFESASSEKKLNMKEPEYKRYFIHSGDDWFGEEDRGFWKRTPEGKWIWHKKIGYAYNGTGPSRCITEPKETVSIAREGNTVRYVEDDPPTQEAMKYTPYDAEDEELMRMYGLGHHYYGD